MAASEEHFAPIIVLGLPRGNRILIIGLRGMA